MTFPQVKQRTGIIICKKKHLKIAYSWLVFRSVKRTVIVTLGSILHKDLANCSQNVRSYCWRMITVGFQINFQQALAFLALFSSEKRRLCYRRVCLWANFIVNHKTHTYAGNNPNLVHFRPCVGDYFHQALVFLAHFFIRKKMFMLSPCRVCEPILSRTTRHIRMLETIQIWFISDHALGTIIAANKHS